MLHQSARIRTNSSKGVSVGRGTTVAPLWKGFSWVFVGTLVYVLSQWGMLSVLSKLGNPEVVGVFSLGVAITTPILLFSGLQLRQVQATDAQGAYSFSEYLGLRFLTTALALPTISGVVFIAGYSRQTVLIVLAVAAAKTFEAVSETFYGFLQNRERMDIVSCSMMIKGPISLLSLGAGFYFTKSLLWAVVAMAASWAIVLVGYDARKCVPLLMREKQEGSESSSKFGYHEHLRPIRRLAWLALPLGFAAALGSLAINVPRYLVEYYLDAHALGIFAAIAYIVVSSRLVAGALGQSASPRLSRYYAEGAHGAFLGLLFRLSLVSMIIGVAGIIAALVAGQWILSLLYTPEYAGHVGLFVLIMVATALNYVASLLNFAMTATRRFRSQIIVQAGVVAVTAIVCVILIPQMGILGAGMALVMGRLFQLVVAFGIVAHALGILPGTTAISEGKR